MPCIFISLIIARLTVARLWPRMTCAKSRMATSVHIIICCCSLCQSPVSSSPRSYPRSHPMYTLCTPGPHTMCSPWSRPAPRNGRLLHNLTLDYIQSNELRCQSRKNTAKEITDGPPMVVAMEGVNRTDFLLNVWCFFRGRVSTEEYWDGH